MGAQAYNVFHIKVTLRNIIFLHLSNNDLGYGKFIWSTLYQYRQRYRQFKNQFILNPPSISDIELTVRPRTKGEIHTRTAR